MVRVLASGRPAWAMAIVFGLVILVIGLAGGTNSWLMSLAGKRRAE